MQNDEIDQFENLFLGVAETNPEAATRIAAAEATRWLLENRP